GFPGERNEDWKFTSVAPIMRTSFRLPSIPGDESPNPPGEGAQVGLPEGVRLMTLRHALLTCPELVERHLGEYADFRSNAFTALNTAFWRNGYFFYVPAGVVVEQPIDVGFTRVDDPAGEPLLFYHRNLIVLERGSQATVVESYAHKQDGRYMNNVLTEV